MITHTTSTTTMNTASLPPTVVASPPRHPLPHTDISVYTPQSPSDISPPHPPAQPAMRSPTPSTAPPANVVSPLLQPPAALSCSARLHARQRTYLPVRTVVQPAPLFVRTPRGRKRCAEWLSDKDHHTDDGENSGEQATHAPRPYTITSPQSSPQSPHSQQSSPSQPYLSPPSSTWRRAHHDVAVHHRTEARAVSPSEQRESKKRPFLARTRAMDRGMGAVLRRSGGDQRVAVVDANVKEVRRDLDTRFFAAMRTPRGVRQARAGAEQLLPWTYRRYLRPVRITPPPSPMQPSPLQPSPAASAADALRSWPLSGNDGVSESDGVSDSDGGTESADVHEHFFN